MIRFEPDPDAWRPVLAGRQLERRHVLMLALAFEVLCLGWVNSDRYRPPAITIDQTITPDNVIT